MELFAIAILAGVGVVHLLPGLAFFRPALLEKLYGAGTSGAARLMLQHRAALLGLVGALLAASTVLPEWRPAAICAGLWSMLTYLWLWLGAGAERAALQRIAIVDAIAAPALLVAAGLLYL